MSFADELRNAPTELKNREKMQADADWNCMIDDWYKLIKRNCQHYAEQGERHFGMYFERYVNRKLEEDEQENAPSWFVRLKPRVLCTLSPSASAKPKPCLSEEDADDLIKKLQARLERDGLLVKIEKKAKEKYIYNRKYREYSDLDKFANKISDFISGNSTGDGYYQKVRVLDSYRYDIYVGVEW